MLAIAIFAVAVLSAVLISWKAMKRSSDVGRIRSLVASKDVTTRSDPEALSTFLFEHEGISGACAVSGVIDTLGTATITKTSATHADNCPSVGNLSLPAAAGKNYNFVGYAVTSAGGEIVYGFHLIQIPVQGDGAAGEVPSCFPGSTLVLVSRTAGVNFYRRIDSFRAGDYVLAISDVNPTLERLAQHQLGDTRQRRATAQLMASASKAEVSELIIHDPATENALRLGLSNGVLITTPSHPFFAIGRGWTHAGQLRLGDQLMTLDGTKVSVRSAREEPPPPVFYNLHLAEDHAYLVLAEGSRSPVIVHNATTQKMGGQGF